MTINLTVCELCVWVHQIVTAKMAGWRNQSKVLTPNSTLAESVACPTDLHLRFIVIRSIRRTGLCKVFKPHIE